MVARGRFRRRSVVAIAAVLIAVFASTVPTSTTESATAQTPSGAAECRSMTDSIDRLYAAYFLRSPDDKGRAYWVDELQSGRQGLASISDFFAVSPEFIARYASLTNGEFVDRIYRNVLDRGPDAEGRAFWVGQLDSGAESRGSTMLRFSESEEFVVRTATATPAAGLFSAYPDGTTFVCGTGSFALATGGRDNIDVIAVQTTTSGPGGWLTVSDGDESLVGEFVPVGLTHLSQSTVTSNGSGATITIQADPGLFVTVVSYDGRPMPNFDGRAGWRPGERLPTAHEFYDDIDSAVAIVDNFWQRSFAAHYGGVYTSPNVTGLYDGTSINAPYCGPFQLLADNAFYCPVDDSVAWDIGLMAEGYQFGDAWVYLVVAHEWGHAIQVRVDPSLVWVGAEPQADCFAGATLFGSRPNALYVDGADPTLIFEQGDQRELEDGLASLGDRMPWTDSRSHGNAEERIAAFERGRDGGVAACHPDPTDIGGPRAPATSVLFR